MHKLNRLFFLSFYLLVITLGLSACSSNEGRQDGIVSTEQSLYKSAQSQLRNKNWSAAAETLQLLEENFPFGSYAEQAQLELIYAYYKTGDHTLAIAASDRFIRLHPQHRNVDYAYYMRGIASFYNETAFTTALISDVSNRDSGSAKDSFNYFGQLLSRYPTSPYVLDARQRMIYLRNVLARQEIHVANYYFRRGAFIAAANRGKFVVESMQGTPAVPDGLAVMSQAYHLLGMNELAESSAKVLAANYPNHPAISEDGSFDYRYKVESKRSWFSYLTFGLLDKSKFIEFDTRDIFNPQFNENLSKETTAEPPRI